MKNHILDLLGEELSAMKIIAVVDATFAVAKRYPKESSLCGILNRLSCQSAKVTSTTAMMLCLV